MSHITFQKNEGETHVYEVAAALVACVSDEEDGQVGISLDFDVRTASDLIGMVGHLLAHLDQVFGESFVATCLSVYALQAGKQVFRDSEDGPHVTILRGMEPREGRDER